MQGAGLVARGRKRGAHRKRRERRPLPGMLLHIDGSRHPWFQDERWYDLIVILDDATSEIYYAQLVEEESTATVMAGLQELRLRQLRTREAANRFLREDCIAEFNRRFQVAPRQRGNAFVPCRSRDLERIFSLQFERSVNRDNTVSFQNLSLQIERVRWRATLAGCQVVVHLHLNGTLSLTHGPHCLGRYDAAGAPLTAQASAELSRGRGTAPFPCNPSPKPTQPNRRGHNFETGHFTCYKNRT